MYQIKFWTDNIEGRYEMVVGELQGIYKQLVENNQRVHQMSDNFLLVCPRREGIYIIQTI